MTTPGQSKKHLVISRLFEMCAARGNLVFNNTEVKAVSAEVGFETSYRHSVQLKRSPDGVGANSPTGSQNKLLETSRVYRG